MNTIYHITTAEEWAAAQAKGAYEAPSLHTEGFIHCSTAGQVEGVLQRYFSGKTNLLRLSIDAEKIKAPLRYELAPSIGQEFPHIYGAVNLDAVTDVTAISA